MFAKSNGGESDTRGSASGGCVNNSADVPPEVKV